jgi:integrase
MHGNVHVRFLGGLGAAMRSDYPACRLVQWQPMCAHRAVLSTSLLPASAGSAVLLTDPLRLAVGAYLGRFKGSSREHTKSDLRVFLTWRAGHGVPPLAAQRAELELYVRWMQETRRYKPSTVSRRISVVAGFYRTCVIDGVLAHSPAQHVRRPPVPPDSPTLGFDLQFEAMLTAARQSANDGDSPWW